MGIICLALLTGCQPDTECRQSTKVVAGISLRGLAVDTTELATEFTSWDSITVQGVGSDSVLYNNSKNISRILVPLRQDSTITAFSVMWHDMEDVIYFRHDNTMRFISMACGCVVYHNIDSVWVEGTWIDSVKILNSAVESIEQDNVKVFTTIYDW